MPVAILLDEHISPETAYRLNALGYDVVPVRDRGLLELKDWALMAWCIENGRAICTRNRIDFQRQHRHRRDRGEEHPGILLLDDDWSQEQVFEALQQFLAGDPDPTLLANHVVELSLADSL